jgi:hypothetical protein
MKKNLAKHNCNNGAITAADFILDHI